MFIEVKATQPKDRTWPDRFLLNTCGDFYLSVPADQVLITVHPDQAVYFTDEPQDDLLQRIASNSGVRGVPPVHVKQLKGTVWPIPADADVPYVVPADSIRAVVPTRVVNPLTHEPEVVGSTLLLFVGDRMLYVTEDFDVLVRKLALGPHARLS